MKTVFVCFPQIAPCSARDPAGRVAETFYVVQDGLVTVTTEEGVPIRDAQGAKVEHKLQADEDPRKIASRLGLRLFRSERGSDFNRATSSLRFPRFVY